MGPILLIAAHSCSCGGSLWLIARKHAQALRQVGPPKASAHACDESMKLLVVSEAPCHNHSTALSLFYPPLPKFCLPPLYTNVFKRGRREESLDDERVERGERKGERRDGE